MQQEFDLNVETVKKKTRSQKEEEKRFLYSEMLFHGHLERMSQTWNGPMENEKRALVFDGTDSAFFEDRP